MKYWREASTLILALRPRSAVGSYQKGAHSVSYFQRHLNDANDPVAPASIQQSADYKILMLRRSAKSSFMPSKLVFPGGVLHDVDLSVDWNPLFGKVTGQSLPEVSGHQAPLLSSTDEWPVPPSIAYRICAVRETFEESGLLLATKGLAERSSSLACSGKELMSAAQEFRQKVDKDPNYFLQMCMELGVVPNIWALSDWGNWLTPVFHKFSKPPPKPKRFNTMFYVCCVDCDVIPQTLADESETTQAEWKSPLTYVEEDMNHWKDSNWPPLAPPQAYEMRRFSQFGSLEELLDECRRRSNAGVKCFMPSFRLCSDAILICLPGDYMYPAEPDYEGTRDLPGPLSKTAAELTDSNQSLNRIIFRIDELQLNMADIDTTLRHTGTVDHLLRNGTFICNI